VNTQEKQIKELIKTPEVVKKMSDYVRLNGFEPHTNPEVLAGQCVLIRDGNLQKFADSTKSYFANEADHLRYLRSQEFAFDAPHGADEIEGKMGWYGFDDEETHHILPLIAGAGIMAGKAIGKAIAKKAAQKAGGVAKKGVLSIFKKKEPATTQQPVGALVQKVGQPVKKLVKLKQKQKAELDSAKAKADYLNAQVQALQMGVPASQVNGQSLETIKLATDINGASNNGANPISNTDVNKFSTPMILASVAGLGVILFLVFRKG
jgi:hypothetical protein